MTRSHLAALADAFSLGTLAAFALAYALLTVQALAS